MGRRPSDSDRSDSNPDDDRPPCGGDGEGRDPEGGGAERGREGGGARPGREGGGAGPGGEGGSAGPGREHGGPRDDPPLWFPGKDLFPGRTPREILEHLIDGDPLELGARCQERIETMAYLLDPARLHLRVVARVAHAAARWRGKPALEPWLAERIDFSIRELIDEDREAQRSGIPPEEQWAAGDAFLSEVLGLEPTLARRACVAFNRQPFEVRSAYFAVAVQGKTVRQQAAEGNGEPAAVRANIMKAVRAISEAIGRPFRGPGRPLDGPGRAVDEPGQPFDDPEGGANAER